MPRWSACSYLRLARTVKCTYVLISPPAEGVSHYQCEVCGHKRISLYPAHMLHRICPKGKGGGEANIRETIEAELQRRFALDATKRTMEEIRTTLDK